MARAPCECEARASRISFSSELETCWDGCRFCMCWSVDILSQTMRTLWRGTSSCIRLSAVHTAFSSAWMDEHHLRAGIVHCRWTLGSLGGPVVTMVQLPSFALPFVATLSV